jgi:hypothetical protein
MSLQTIRVKIFGLTLAAALFAGVGLAQADPIITITVNEYGVGILNNPAPFAMPGVLKPDPGPHGLAAALTYDLLGPPSLVAGDLFVMDSLGVMSDVIRFNPAGTALGYNASLVFYSDLSEDLILQAVETGGLADTGFPDAFYFNYLQVTEVTNSEGDGFTYTPTSTQPGYVQGFAVTYNIQSDGPGTVPNPVPEPATMALVGSGLVAAFRARKQRPAR